MKKKKLLTVVLSFMLVFSFLLSSSSMVLAEGTITADSVAEQENTDSSSEDTVLDEESNEEISNEDMLETGETPSDDLNEEDVATDEDAAEEESVEDRELIEAIKPNFLRAPRATNGQSGYIGWKTAATTGYTDKFYIAVKGVNGTTEVAYCYNFEKTFPGTRGEDFSKIANASSQVFQDLVGNSRLSGDALKTKILQICYEGYPKNSKSLKSKYSLSDDEFCLITQAAIWYYTDSKDVMGRGQYFDQSHKFQSMVRKANVQNAYNELRNTNVTLPSNYELDLYYPTNAGSRVQNLLSTKFKQDTAKRFEFYLDKRTEAGQGLQGATLQLLYSNGNLIQQWTSDGNARLFEAEAGSYIFRETHAPSGYDKASDIHFNIDGNGNVTSNNGSVEGNKKVVMVDRQSKPHITIRKVSPDGNALSGADLQILNSDGTKVIQQWTTDGNEKSIPIDAGDYIFRETKSPQGYDKVSDFHFSVGQTGNITLKDTSLSYVKVEGNKLIITDSKEVPKTTRKVEKKWRDTGFESERPEYVKIQLLADGKNYRDPVTLNDTNGWVHEWNDLPEIDQAGKTIDYTVQEVDMAGKRIGFDYIPDYRYKDGVFTVTNIKGLEMVISKEVIGDGGDKTKEFTFEITLNFMDTLTHQLPVSYEGSVLSGYEGKVEAPQGGTLVFDPATMKATIKLKHGQQITLKNILYTPYLMYTVKEVEENQDGYKTTYNDQDTAPTGECTNHIAVRVKNTKAGTPTPPPTGIFDNDNGSRLLLSISIAGLLLVAIGYVLRLRKGLKQ